MSGGNKSYNKGYRNESKIRKILEELGLVTRAHQSGAYTGEADLTWFPGNVQAYTVDCKSGDGWSGKRHRVRLEAADICVDSPDREIPIIIMPLPKFIHLLKQMMSYGPGD
jgi:hypothetical protein